MNKRAIVLVVLLLLSVFIVTSETVNAQNSGIIRIKADGTVTGTDKIKQEGTVYTLTDDLYASVGQNEAFIFIEKSDITFNGASHTVRGSGLGSAIYLLRSQNVTIENFIIRDFNIGIDFWIVGNWPSDSTYLNQPSAFNNKILNNEIEVSNNSNGDQSKDAGWCIYLSDAIQTTISDNIFTCQNPHSGVYFSNSTKNTNLINNSFNGCSLYSSSSNQTTAYGNTVDGKPLIYLENKSFQVLENAGLVFLFNCSDISVKNVNPLNDYEVAIKLVDTIKSDISNSSGHVLLVNSSYNSIHDNILNSITLDASSYNQVFTNKITQFSVCIKLYRNSSFNKIYSNLLLDTTNANDIEKTYKASLNTAAIQIGDIQFGGAFNNNISDNMIVNHDCGFEFFLSAYNNVTYNIIKNCKAGIQLGRSDFNVFTENDISSCRYGVSIYAEASNNLFYLNNFIDNKIHCYETHEQTLLSERGAYSTGNMWDNSQIGNYWDTYTGIDTNSDGIGDTPYNIFEDMIDNYPLIEPLEIYSSHKNDLPEYDPTINPTPTDDTQKPLSRETMAIIIAGAIILCITGSLLVYFRRLIFR